MADNNRPTIYYKSLAELMNGSFYRKSKFGIGWYMNGDYMGEKKSLSDLPQGLICKEYNKEVKQLLPKCCQ